jgi:type IV secretion system protein VirB9
MFARLGLGLLLLASAAGAQVYPVAPAGDSRLQTITYDPAQVVQLHATAGYQLTVQLSPDEQVQNVVVGDASGWQVSVNAARNLIFVKPNDIAQPTNMTAFTNVRTYNFELTAAPMATPDMAFSVRFRYSGASGPGQSGEFVDVSAAQRRLSRYKLSGDRLLRPSSISNDGRYTYIVWPKEQDLPATYELAGRGEELLVNGIMRDDVLVIDRVITSLIFRRDRSQARAVLVQPKRKG